MEYVPYSVFVLQYVNIFAQTEPMYPTKHVLHYIVDKKRV